jgi:hypothetical protein
MTSDPRDRPDGQVDFELVFHLLPGMCLVLDPTFTILAQNAEHARATLSADKDVVGQNLFAVFPDNPDYSAADGVSTVRALPAVRDGFPRCPLRFLGPPSLASRRAFSYLKAGKYVTIFRNRSGLTHKGIA